MDTSTYEILKECNSGCRMALNSIEQLAVYLKSQELQDLFCKYKEDYEKMDIHIIEEQLEQGKVRLMEIQDLIGKRTYLLNEFNEWTIVNKVDTIYKEKCRVQLLSAVPSTILLFHLVSSFRENYAVSWHYRILRCIRIQITGVPAENDMFYG